MTAIQATIVGAFIGSPILVALFEYISDKLRAEFRYKGWQAIFLDNGHIYFGKIATVNKAEIEIREIYYLQESNTGKHTPSGEIPEEYTLIKLGNEVHAPTDRMVVNRGHVLFTERLAEDGKVLEAVRAYKAQQEIKASA